jgi:hypothetical protein
MSFDQLKGTWFVRDSDTGHEAAGHQVVIAGTETAPTVTCQEAPVAHRYPDPSYSSGARAIQGLYADKNGYQITLVEIGPPRKIKCRVGGGVVGGPGTTGSWTADDNPSPEG